MFVDPNEAIQMSAEHILCEGGFVHLFDGSKVSKDDLASAAGPFAKFCEQVDPNRCFIVAHVPYEVDQELYLAVRAAANRLGRHMQADIDTPERHLEMWRAYVQSKRNRSSKGDEDAFDVSTAEPAQAS